MAYLQYCKEVVFAGAQTPPGLGDVGHFLDRVANGAQRLPGGWHWQAEFEGMDEGVECKAEVQQHELHNPEGSAMPCSSHHRLHPRPHCYHKVPARMHSTETMHPDVLAVAAACGALVNVHPDVILRQMSALQQSLLAMDGLLCDAPA